MKFSLTEEQLLLQETLNKFISEEYSYEQRRVLSRTDEKFSREHWDLFANLGWLSIPFSEENGGYGGNARDIALVMEAFGKGLVLEPYVSTAVLCGRLLDKVSKYVDVGTWIESIVERKQLFSLADNEANGELEFENIETRAVMRDQYHYLNGVKSFVMDGASADYFLVTAYLEEEKTAENYGLFLVASSESGVDIKNSTSVDGHSISAIELSGAKGILLSQGQSVLNALEETVYETIIAMAAECVGMMKALLDETVEYAKGRKQFGTSISNFQVLQHRMADMYIHYVGVRSQLLRTIVSIEGDKEEFKKNVFALKYLMSEQAQKTAHASIQIFGGMGMTDEVCVGMYLKRIIFIGACFGSGEQYLQKMSV